MQKLVWVISLAVLLIGCNTVEQQPQHSFTNALVHETSPYLLQHAHNPVNWMPWGAEALAKAKSENKLLLISIGYSSCHWCHVMEEESFEDTAVARIMNENFVAVKVDREERPDVDDVYMTAVQLLTGSGGWPLNAFALPDGKPVYGGTYFPKDQWVQLLERLSVDYAKDPAKFQEYANNLAEGVNDENLDYSVQDTTAIEMSDINNWMTTWKAQLDYQWGGLGTGEQDPKFPNPTNINTLLRWAVTSGDKQLLDQVELTLDKMEQGGIYDQIGGGFARYATDRYWMVPHFEKMLYDNAQLLSVYANGYKVFKKERYKQVIAETVDFLQREMKDPSGGYYSALDADSEGKEGKYYVWKKDELQAILGNEFETFARHFEVNEKGLWEHGNYVLLRNPDSPVTPEIKALSDKLLKERAKRVRPGLDDKILTSWNALLLTGFVDAYKATRNETYLELAKELASFLTKKTCHQEMNVWHSIQKGKPKIEGFLDDYVFLAKALQDLSEVARSPFGNPLLDAEQILNRAFDKFQDEQEVFWYYSDGTPKELFTRKKELYDNVIPGSNSTMAKLLWRQGHLFGSSSMSARSTKMLKGMRGNMLQAPNACGNWIDLAMDQAMPYYEIVTVGPDANIYQQQLHAEFMPNVAWAFSNKANENYGHFKDRFVEGKTLIYICQNQACLRPMEDVEQALEVLKR